MTERIAEQPIGNWQSDRHNLPMQLTSFIGREREVAAVRTLLQRPEVRLVTITGPGGIGKTRLGLQVAAELSDVFSYGVFFVNLAPLSDPELVVPTIAQTLGLKEAAGQPLLDLVSAWLREKELLLLLDNFEQVIGAAVEVTALLARCPKLNVLVTSRAVLHVRGEQEFAVPPLAVPDPKGLPDLVTLSHYEAVALFIARAQAVNPGFHMNDANAAAIAVICTRLDGLPLAIELAAARIKLLPPQALLSRLEHRLQVLTGGAQDAPRRQQTLRNTIEWSYELLDARGQCLFRRLSVFVGGCALEAFEAVCTALDGGAEAVLDSVSTLLDESLLQHIEQEDGGTRLLMLETIREYGLEMLAAAEEEEIIRQAHAHYYLSLAERAESYLHGPEQAVWFDRLEQERDNLRAAFHWLLEREGDSERSEMAQRLGGALWWFWFVRGPVSEGWTVLSWALARSEGVAVAVRAKTLWAAGWLVGLLGDPERAETLCKESLVLYQEIGDKAGVAMASLILGIAALWKSQLAVARSRFDESLELFRDLGDKEYIGWSLHHLAAVALWQGEFVRACLLAEESLELFRELGNTGAVEIVLPYLAQALFFQGDAAKAQVVLEEGLAISKQIGHKGWECLMLSLLGQVFLQQDNIALARSGLEESLALSRELGLQDFTASSLCVLASIEAGQGNHATARALYEEGLALSRDGGNYKWEIASFLEGLAAVVVPEGEPAWAARLWGAAEALPAIYHADYEQAVAAARVLLGEQAFATAWVEGRGMTKDQVLVAREAVTMPVAASPVHVAASPAGKSAPTYPDGLTAREVEVLRLVSQGLTDAQIAEQLIISPRTVNTHLTAIYGKIQVSSRSAATRYAIENHLT